jgi:hypothetical protein
MPTARARLNGPADGVNGLHTSPTGDRLNSFLVGEEICCTWYALRHSWALRFLQNVARTVHQGDGWPL